MPRQRTALCIALLFAFGNQAQAVHFADLALPNMEAGPDDPVTADRVNIDAHAGHAISVLPGGKLTMTDTVVRARDAGTTAAQISGASQVRLTSTHFRLLDGIGGISYGSDAFGQSVPNTSFVYEGGEIKTWEQNSTGINAWIPADMQEFRLDEVNISTDGPSAAAGVFTGGMTLGEDGMNADRRPMVAHRSAFTTRGSHSPAFVAESVELHTRDTDFFTLGERAPAIDVAGSKLDLHGGWVCTSGNHASALMLAGSDVAMDNTIVRTDGDNAIPIQSDGGSIAMKGGALSATHDTLIEATAATAVTLTGDARATGKVLISYRGDAARPDNDNAVRLFDRAYAEGDIIAPFASSSIEAALTIADHAAWKGRSEHIGRARLQNGGTWILTGDATVKSLSMENGVLRFERLGDDHPHTLTITGDLTGQGRFELNSDLARERANLVNVLGSANGTHRLLVRNTGEEPRMTAGAIALMRAGGGDATVSLENRDGFVEAGVFRYALRKTREEETGQVSWELVQAGTRPPPPEPQLAPSNRDPELEDPPELTWDDDLGIVDAPPAPAEAPPPRRVARAAPGAPGSDPGPNPDSQPESAPDSGGADATAPPAETTPPSSQGSEPESAPEPAPEPAPGPDAGPQPAPQPQPAPAPPRPSKANLSSTASAVVNTTNVGTLALIRDAERQAYARRFEELQADSAESTVWVQGLGMRQKLDNGLGRDFSQNLSGFTVGADRPIDVASGRWHVGTMAGHTDVRRSFGDEGNGKTRSLHAGAYARFKHCSGVYAHGAVTFNHFDNRLTAVGSDGRAARARYHANGIGASLEGGRRVDLPSGWFLQPTAGADYFALAGARFRTSNGMTVKADRASAWQVRGAVRAGRDIALHNGSSLSPYVQVGWVQQLGAKSTVVANNQTLRSDTSGGRLETRVGVTAQIAKQHAVYADYGHAKGSRYAQPWSATAGYRYSF